MFINLTIKIKKDFSYNLLRKHTKMIIGIQRGGGGEKQTAIWLFSHLELSCKTLTATHQEVLAQLWVGKVNNNLNH